MLLGSITRKFLAGMSGSRLVVAVFVKLKKLFISAMGLGGFAPSMIGIFPELRASSTGIMPQNTCGIAVRCYLVKAQKKLISG